MILTPGELTIILLTTNDSQAISPGKQLATDINQEVLTTESNVTQAVIDRCHVAIMPMTYTPVYM